MRAFLMMYVTDFETIVDKSGKKSDKPRTVVVRSGKSRASERRAFTVLSSVCWHWYWTLTGWPQSPTGDWVKHQLSKLIQREDFVFRVNYILLFEIGYIDQVEFCSPQVAPSSFWPRCEWFHCPIEWLRSFN